MEALLLSLLISLIEHLSLHIKITWEVSFNASAQALLHVRGPWWPGHKKGLKVP